MAHELAIQEVFANVALRKQGRSFPGHCYLTRRGMLWSPASAPLHQIEPQRHYYESLVRIWTAFWEIAGSVVSFYPSVILPNPPGRTEVLFSDIVGTHLLEKPRRLLPKLEGLRVHTVHGDVELATTTELAESLRRHLNAAIGVGEEVPESPFTFYVYVDVTLTEQLFAATPQGTVTEFIKEVSKRFTTSISGEAEVKFISKLAASLQGEIGDKTIVKEQLSILHKLGLGALYLYEQGQIERLSSLDLRSAPKSYLYVDSRADRLRWAPGSKSSRRRKDVKLSLVGTLYDLVDISMPIDRSSVEHLSGFEALLDESSPNLHGIAKVVAFERQSHRLKLVPLFLAI